MIRKLLVISMGACMLAQEARPESFALAGGETSLPMLDIGGRPVAEVRINGKGPYRFIVDTGVHVTAVDSGLASELALPEVRGAKVPEGEAPSVVVRAREIRLGTAALRDIAVITAPLAEMFSGGEAPRGVLGAASFPGYLVVLDYPGKRIVIRKGALGAADGRTTFEYAANKLLPMVPVRVAGVETQVDLDSGAPMGLTLPMKFLKQVVLASEAKEVGRARTPAGEFSISSAKVDGVIELGQYRLDLAEVSFSDVAPGPAAPNGNIGYQVLRGFRVTFDSENRRIRLER